ncbi:MAG: hypothetical protein WCS37_16275 [Chloroflexota bacterium]|nr:hypothetical protein [Chloroflexota bacterium]
MSKSFKAVCVYEDGSKDEAKVTITSEGGTIFQIAWQISNGETGRFVLEGNSIEEIFALWCEDNEFEPAN